MSGETVGFNPDEIQVTGNRYADQFVTAAGDLGLDVDIVDSVRGIARIHDGSRQFAVRAAIVGCNNLVAARLASNKTLTSIRLQRAGFRVPPFEFMVLGKRDDPDVLIERLLQFASRHYPVVLKAEKGHGGTNVYAGLESESDVRWAASELLRAGLHRMLIEKHVHGCDYRIKLFDGVVIDLIKRTPGALVGDGRSTITNLIDQLNQRRKAENVSSIKITPKLLRLLERGGRTTDDVLAAGEIQPIGIECNEGSGGSSEKLPVSCIPPAAARMFAEIAKASGLRYLAIDYICRDIESGDAHLTGYINEVNSAPIINEYIEGKSRDWYLSYARYVLEQYFELSKKR